MKETNNLPKSTDSIFQRKDSIYEIFDCGKFRDPISAMRKFIEGAKISANDVILDEGEKLILYHPNYTFLVTVKAYSVGSGSSFAFETSKLAKEDFINSYPELDLRKRFGINFVNFHRTG